MVTLTETTVTETQTGELFIVSILQHPDDRTLQEGDRNEFRSCSRTMLFLFHYLLGSFHIIYVKEEKQERKAPLTFTGILYKQYMQYSPLAKCRHIVTLALKEAREYSVYLDAFFFFFSVAKKNMRVDSQEQFISLCMQAWRGKKYTLKI